MADDGRADRAPSDPLEAMVEREGALSPEQIALLRKAFPGIVEAHHEKVREQLERRRLQDFEIEELVQEAFIRLFARIMEKGFPHNLPGLLHDIAHGLFLNHLRARRRAPMSMPLPSSGSEKPPSAPDLDRMIDLQALAEVLPSLVPEHRAVVEVVILNHATVSEAAVVLGWPEGTVKSRLRAAKRALRARLEPLLPPSQRGG